MENSVSSKQLIVITFIVGMAMKMFMLPSILLRSAGRDSFITMALYLAVELFILFMILYANKRMPETSFFKLCESVLGKVFSKILIGVAALFFLYKLNLTVGETQVFFTVSVFENLEWAVYVIPLLALLFAVGLKTLRTIGRLTEIFTPIIFISIVLLMALVIGGVDFENLLPVLGDGPGKTVDAFLKHSVWMGDFSIMVVFLGKVDRKKHTLLFSMISAGAAFIFVMFFTVVICATYGNLSDLIDYGHNLSNMTEYMGSHNFGRYDLIIFSVWIISVFLMMAVNFFLVNKCVSYVIGVNNDYITGGAVCLIVYLMQIILLPNQNALYSFSMLPAVRIVSLVAQLLIPLFVFVVSLIKGGGNKDKKPGRALYEKT